MVLPAAFAMRQWDGPLQRRRGHASGFVKTTAMGSPGTHRVEARKVGELDLPAAGPRQDVAIFVANAIAGAQAPEEISRRIRPGRHLVGSGLK